MKIINKNIYLTNRKISFIQCKIISLAVIISGSFIVDFYGNNYLAYAAKGGLKNQSNIIYDFDDIPQNDIIQVIQQDHNNTKQKNIAYSKLTKDHAKYDTVQPDLKNNLISIKDINQRIEKISNTNLQIKQISCNCDCKAVKKNNLLNCKSLQGEEIQREEKWYDSVARNDISSLSSEVESDLILGLKLDRVKNEEKNKEIDLKFQKIKQTSQLDDLGKIGNTLGQADTLRNQLLIDPIIIKRLVTKRDLRIAPASSSGTPSAYGATWGQGYFGGGIFLPFDDDGNPDGSFALGFGLGDAVKSIGMEINVNVTSVGGGNDFDFADSGTIGFKLHKYFNPDIGVAFGWVDPISWGDSNNAKDTFYGVVTKSFKLKPENTKNNLPLIVSLGIGSGIFRSIGAIRSGENSVNVFASLGLRLTPQFALSSSWTGNRLNLGASVVPLKNTPIVVNAVITDVTDNLENGTGLSLSAGYAFQF